MDTKLIRFAYEDIENVVAALRDMMTKENEEEIGHLICRLHNAQSALAYGAKL